ncbi:uncharacterized protein At1g08160-like [Silene latifolia]|uniref:uncharacterized protein At1g08160-like n=1 Tax=Silene latifolia TaxID=37657 RepID=UPI003D7842AC
MSTLSCIVCTFAYLIILFAIVGIPLIVYYAQDPKDPTFTLEHASVNGFNLTSDGHLTSFFNIVLKANNPSRKMKLKYSKVRVSIYKDKQILAKDALDDFAQRKHAVTMLRPEPVALDLSLDKGPRFNLELESGMGYISFGVFMTSDLNGDNLEVTCSPVFLNITISNSLVASSPADAVNTSHKFQSMDCNVYVYSDDD